MNHDKKRDVIFRQESISQKTPKRSQQYIMWKIALHGKNAYADYKWKELTPEQKSRAILLKDRAQRSINLLKQERINLMTCKLFEKLFPKNELGKALAVPTECDPDFVSNMSFKDLGLNQQIITKRLIEDKVFPQNYYQL